MLQCIYIVQIHWTFQYTCNWSIGSWVAFASVCTHILFSFWVSPLTVIKTLSLFRKILIPCTIIIVITLLLKCYCVESERLSVRTYYIIRSKSWNLDEFNNFNHIVSVYYKIEKMDIKILVSVLFFFFSYLLLYIMRTAYLYACSKPVLKNIFHII